VPRQNWFWRLISQIGIERQLLLIILEAPSATISIYVESAEKADALGEIAPSA
jgi:hypothetical protein